MSSWSWKVTLSLIATLSSVTYGFLGHVIEDVAREETDSLPPFDYKQRALHKLQEVLGLPHSTERRHHQVPPQFMTELYKNIADQSGVTRRRNPYNAKVVRSFIERDTSMSHYFYFNISGLDMTERILEAQLHLYRMRSRPQDLHPSVFTSPSLIIRVYQVLDEQSLEHADTHRLLSSHMVGAHSNGWEVFNVKEAVLDWVTARRKNKGLLVTCNTLFEQKMEIRFVRRNEHHNSKQPILVLFDDEETTVPVSSQLYTENPEYYRYGSYPHSEEHGASHLERRRRSLPTPMLASNRNSTNSTGECTKLELYVDFEHIGWSSWIISPKGYFAHYCKGHCNFPLGQSQRPSNHATVQSIVHELRLDPDVEKPSCVPISLVNLPLLFFDDNENVVLRIYEDMIADACGCQ